MTIHSSKGLEFKSVFIIAMESGIFPSMRSEFSVKDIEEERRLAYVAITRAKEELTITTTKSRRLFGRCESHSPSRFLCEIDRDLLEIKGFKNNSPEKNKKISGHVYTSPSPASYDEEYMKKLTVGTTVEHRKFGRGIILTSKPMGNDLLLEVSFDNSGTRKIMAGFAKLKVVTL